MNGLNFIRERLVVNSVMRRIAAGPAAVHAAASARRIFVTAIAKLGTAWIVLAAVPAQAQKPDNSQPAPRASVAQVTDRRSGDPGQSSGCTVDLKFTGARAKPPPCLRNLHVDEAVDEYGHDLRTEQPVEPGGGIFSLHDRTDHPLGLEILLKNPPRKSTLIKELKGGVQLFTPSDANGGLVTLPDFSSTPGKPVENSVLEKHGIRLLNLTPPDFKNLKKNQRKEMLNAARKAGLTDEEIRQLNGNIREAGEFSTPADPAKTLVIYRQDPEKMIVQAEVQDAAGRRVAPNEIDTFDNLSLLYFEDDLPKNINLVLRLAVPAAIKDCPFDFHDIPLP